MARVTVEDCLERVPNCFELVLLAAHRVRNVSSGEALIVERDNDKNSVLALREIADKKMNIDVLRNSLISSFQNLIEHDEPVDEDISSIMQEAMTARGQNNRSDKTSYLEDYNDNDSDDSDSDSDDDIDSDADEE